MSLLSRITLLKDMTVIPLLGGVLTLKEELIAGDQSGSITRWDLRTTQCSEIQVGIFCALLTQDSGSRHRDSLCLRVS
jgi:hypothetical protein